ncbi:hypothetical protein PJI16_03545 [Nitrospira sp. MA-1]|nr:hypothetical protein [Nitrospira sp. MA-1]
MRQNYIIEYKADRQLRSSLELMMLHIAKTVSDTGLVNFSFIFIRLADRVLYHATNVWEHFERDLQIPAEILQLTPKGAEILTSDVTSKYEIEAYLGAAKALFEVNLIGINHKKNLLGKCFVEEQDIGEELSAQFEVSKGIFHCAANKIRNHSYHVNSQFRDAGYHAWVKQVDTKYVVTIPNIYVDEQGESIDLANTFVSTHQTIKQLLVNVRDILQRYYFEKYAPPINKTIIPIKSPFGILFTSLGPDGFEFQDFPIPGQSEPDTSLHSDAGELRGEG